MAQFFQIAGQFTEFQITELLLKRYGRLDYFEELSARDFIEFFIVAANEKTKEDIYLQWLAILPKMYDGTLKLISFDEFYNIASGTYIDRRMDADLYAEIEKAERELNGYI